jgi:aspartate dehydrogenase
MHKRLKIGIVGCGAIGSSLARAIRDKFSAKALLTAVFDKDNPKATRVSRSILKKDVSVKNITLLVRKVDLVIEAASALDSWKIAREALGAGKDVMLMSVGGVIGRLAQLKRLAEKNNARVYIPSGAISGLDALKASSMGKIKEVVLITRKHPTSFKGVRYIQDKGIKLDSIRQDRVLFSGSARQAVKYFPQNINVAAVLSLAGIGQDKTKVKIIASPLHKKNIHDVRIVSDAGEVNTRTINVLHPSNPKTSFLAVLSAAATLKQILEPLKLGS